ncbi:unnamed protein product [Meganyctiphanes norvegica]|uniref:Uncharacterized protein n=1 Tax=Meganyctiphanes norvegica TaxID=48144 RepID=A0AAV2Q182_MEGNR
MATTTDDNPDSKMEGWDYAVVGIYFAAVLAVGLFTSWRARKASGGNSLAGYFMASRSMHWIPVGASLFASNIGSGHFIGLAGSGAASGIGIGAFELNAIYVLILLGWLFVPVYMSSGIFTMPEYLRERFGGQRIRIYLSVLALMLYVFTKISADLFAGALFIQEATGNTDSEEWLYISVLILLAIAAVFTISGGLTAVIWTDFIQTILMIIGALILMGMSFEHEKVGGFGNLVGNYFEAIPNDTVYNGKDQNCGEPPSYAMHFFRSAKAGESDLPWPGMLLGVTVSGIWYWCTDQVIVQRTLSSKSIVHAKAGCLLAGVIKFLPLFILVFPGMASRIIFTDTVACVNKTICQEQCGADACTNSAYIKLVLDILPTGLRGMMFAVMMAALMSSLTSVFNSASTIFTIDIWTRIRKQADETELLIVGRVFVLALVVISVAWIPVIQSSQNSQLFVYIQSISSFLSPPVCAVYLLAVFWQRTNEPGAFWGLMSGLAIGMVRFVLEFAWTVPPCGYEEDDKRPEIIKQLVGNLHYLHFGIVLFVIVLIITIAVSLLTPPIDEKHLHRLTWGTRMTTEIRIPISKKSQTKENHSHTNPAYELDAKENTGTTNETMEANDSIKKAHSESTSSSLRNNDLPWFQRMFNCVCGVESSSGGPVESPPEISPEQKAKDAALFLHESPTGKMIVNSSAVIIMILTAFLWGYYA